MPGKTLEFSTCREWDAGLELHPRPDRPNPMLSLGKLPLERKTREVDSQFALRDEQHLHSMEEDGQYRLWDRECNPPLPWETCHTFSIRRSLWTTTQQGNLSSDG